MEGRRAGQTDPEPLAGESELRWVFRETHVRIGSLRQERLDQRQPAGADAVERRPFVVAVGDDASQVAGQFRVP